MKTTHYTIWAETKNQKFCIGIYDTLEEAKAKFEKIDEKEYSRKVYITRTITETTNVLSKTLNFLMGIIKKGWVNNESY